MYRNKKPKRTFSYMNPKLEVRETGKYGKGILPKFVKGKKIYKKKANLAKGFLRKLILRRAKFCL